MRETDNLGNPNHRAMSGPPTTRWQRGRYVGALWEGRAINGDRFDIDRIGEDRYSLWRQRATDLKWTLHSIHYSTMAAAAAAEMAVVGTHYPF